MRRTHFTLLFPFLLFACGDDGGTDTPSDANVAGQDASVGQLDASPPGSDAGAEDVGSSGDGGDAADGGIDEYPPPPELGTTLLDRAGRPAITTALIQPIGDEPAKSQTKDAYNAEANPTRWGAAFGAEIAKSLALYDGLDASCGNQVLAGPNAEAGRYSALSSVMADDRLYIRSDARSCGQYLAVELGITGDCGGRAPSYDVIDTSYSVLATGQASGVRDGIDRDNALQSDSSFPFFAAP